jgi:hypothetical protein
MTKTICGTAALLMICFAIVVAGRPLQNQPVRAGRLDPQIGRANPQRYKSIRDGQDWENPRLIIRRDGIEVIAKGSPPGGQIVASTDLQRTLIELPVSAWPYGKVVIVRDIGIVDADGADEQPTNENREAALAILKALQITVERWPS